MLGTRMRNLTCRSVSVEPYRGTLPIRRTALMYTLFSSCMVKRGVGRARNGRVRMLLWSLWEYCYMLSGADPLHRARSLNTDHVRK